MHLFEKISQMVHNYHRGKKRPQTFHSKDSMMPEAVSPCLNIAKVFKRIIAKPLKKKLARLDCTDFV
jgi:hypothetical protein